MTLNTISIIAGLQCLPVLTEGEKSQLQLTFPDLAKKTVKNKKTGEKEEVVCFVAKRSISDVTRFFAAITDPAGRLAMAEMQLPEAAPVIYKALKETGGSPLDFYLEASALIESMEAEVESVSGADPSNIIGQFLAANFSSEDTVPTAENFMAVLNEKLVAYFTPEKVNSTISQMTDKENELGRLDSGQIRWRKPRTVKEESK